MGRFTDCITRFLYLVLGAFIMLCVNYDAISAYETTSNKNVVTERMVEVDNYVSDGTRFFVWVDTETDVMYLGVSYGGISVMLDADGNPLLYEEE